MINEISKKIILDSWAARDSCISYPLATQNEISDFECSFGEIPEDYKWFLTNCGGGVVCSEWLEKIDELEAAHIKFKNECEIENGWSTGHCFIIGWDGSGSPISIAPDGRILVEWEADREVYQVASSLEKWLLEDIEKING